MSIILRELLALDIWSLGSGLFFGLSDTKDVVVILAMLIANTSQREFFASSLLS